MHCCQAGTSGGGIFRRKFSDIVTSSQHATCEQIGEADEMAFPVPGPVFAFSKTN
jgi:hypothetical protein